MKYTFGFDSLRNMKKKEEWHVWFAWHPVTISVNRESGKKTLVIFQKVLRRGWYRYGIYHSYYEWSYKELNDE